MIITISRLFGSGGSDVAKLVAQELGWSLLDNKVIDEVAERLGVSVTEISRREERVPSLAERIASSMTMSAPELSVPVDDASLVESPEERILAVTRSVIEEAVQQGSAVLVGRGAQCMLADRADTLHVFCHAPLASLVEYAVAHRGLDPASAEQEVIKTNKQREQYVRRNWGRDWRALENYDLCIDTSRIGIPASAAVVVSAAKERFGLQ